MPRVLLQRADLGYSSALPLEKRLSMGTATIAGPDGLPRCPWCMATAGYRHYHDTEWGFPVADDQRLFEKLCLEGFQSGLSWRTILEKRDNFRVAFDGFDFHRVAAYTETDVQRLLQDAGIIRHRGKIASTINNARCALDLINEAGSLAAFVWRFEPRRETLPEPATVTTSPESIELSRALKKRGWKFVGPTTMYSFMQAMGLINDHVEGCVTRAKVEKARRDFRSPVDWVGR